MRTQIIEILQKRYPEYCMQHIDTANEILRLFSVVQQSEQYTCECKVCGKPFGDKLSLYEHYNEEHN